MIHCAKVQSFGVKCMALGRPLQVSLVGGSLASIALRAAEQLLGPAAEPFLPTASCPLCPLDEDGWHAPSFLWGLLVGLLLGPVIDFLFYLRVAWGRFVRARLLPSVSCGPLFRILS